jgi:hypothetical protein
MARQPQHLCFYSNKCEWSRTFITEISNTPYKTEFNYICVDPSPNRPQLPGWLKKVPTLVIRGESEPRVDSEVMNWLFERRLRDGAAHKPAGKAGQGAAAAGGAGAEDPDAFNTLEMGGMGTDTYSFLDSDGATGGNGGARIQHNFAFLNDAGGAGARQSATVMTSHNDKRSKKEELFDAQMEAYQRERAQGMPQMVMRQ